MYPPVNSMVEQQFYQHGAHGGINLSTSPENGNISLSSPHVQLQVQPQGQFNQQHQFNHAPQQMYGAPQQTQHQMPWNAQQGQIGYYPQPLNSQGTQGQIGYYPQQQHQIYQQQLQPYHQQQPQGYGMSVAQQYPVNQPATQFQVTRPAQYPHSQNYQPAAQQNFYNPEAMRQNHHPQSNYRKQTPRRNTRFQDDQEYEEYDDEEESYYEPSKETASRRKKTVKIQPVKQHVSLSTTERYKQFKNNAAAQESEADSGIAPSEVREFEPYSFRDWLTLKSRDATMKSATGLGPNAVNPELRMKLDRAQEFSAKIAAGRNIRRGGPEK